jgi:hypothetical protein
LVFLPFFAIRLKGYRCAAIAGAGVIQRPRARAVVE